MSFLLVHNAKFTLGFLKHILNKLVEGYRNELLNILENRKYWIKQ